MAGEVDQPQGNIHDQKRWLITGELPCLGCGYNLRGLVGPVLRCPECAHKNDLRDPKPWRAKALPVGVRERQHWPASAVLLSFPALPVTYVAIMLSVEDIITGSKVTLIAIPLMLVWLMTCVRWVKSCQRPIWSFVVLLGLHLANWVMLLGFTIAILSEFKTPYVYAGFGVPLGLIGYKWVAAALKNAENAGHYRQDWRNWRLPVE